MANIDIQRKSSSNAIWWILGIVALVVLLFVMFGRGNSPQTVGMAPDAPGVAAHAVGSLVRAQAFG